MRACMDENGMNFDEDSIEELTHALFQVMLVPSKVNPFSIYQRSIVTLACSKLLTLRES